MRHLATALPLLLAALLSAPVGAQSPGDHFHDLSDGQVYGKRIEEGHAILDLFSTSGDGVMETLCPLAQTGEMLSHVCDMIDIGDIASLWRCLEPDPTSDFPTIHRLTSVTIGRHEDRFAVYDGQVTGKRIDGAHVILDLSGSSPAGILQVVCPMYQSGDLLAETCNMIEIGDVASLWDGLEPDQTSDYPTLRRLTSVTFGTPEPVEIFADGFESGNLLAWSSSHP